MAASTSTMTGSSMNVGNQISERASTRVVAPPGGSSSISFLLGGTAPAPPKRGGRGAGAFRPAAEPVAYGAGAYAPAEAHDAPVTRRPVEFAPASRSVEHSGFGSPGASAPPPSRVAAVAAARAAAEATSYGATKAPASSVASIGGSSLSSNSYASGSNQNAGNVLTDRRTTRVLAAPGGKSSIVFG